MRARRMKAVLEAGGCRAAADLAAAADNLAAADEASAADSPNNLHRKLPSHANGKVINGLRHVFNGELAAGSVAANALLNLDAGMTKG